MNYKIQEVLEMLDCEESISENTTNALFQIEQNYIDDIDNLKSNLRRKHDILTNNNCAITDFSKVSKKRNDTIKDLKEELKILKKKLNKRGAE